MAKKNENVRIVIAPFGWVFVGKYSQEARDGQPVVVLRNASVIRKWGTDKGLGQLITGPRKETVLDPCGTVEIHLQTVVATIECVSGWDI